jgi:hypothetical protein
MCVKAEEFVRADTVQSPPGIYCCACRTSTCHAALCWEPSVGGLQGHCCLPSRHRWGSHTDTNTCDSPASVLSKGQAHLCTACAIRASHYYLPTCYTIQTGSQAAIECCAVQVLTATKSNKMLRQAEEQQSLPCRGCGI